MIDHDAAYLALRTRATGMTGPTTGSTSLSATVTGYARTAGSFITDGFRPGMEVLPSGFTANAYQVVTEVSALALSVANTLTAESSASGRTIAVGFPETRIWENAQAMQSGVIVPTQVSGRPYVMDSYVPAGSELATLPAAGGDVEERGLYVIHWFGLTKYGPHAIRKCVSAVVARFTPSTTIIAGSNVLRIGGGSDDKPRGAWADEIRQLDNGFAVSTIRVPWWARSTNLIAA